MQQIDDKASRFWAEYSRREADVYSLMNLEPEAERARRRFAIESERVGNVVDFEPEAAAVDLGAGAGLWSAFLASRLSRVFAVERQPVFVGACRVCVREAGLENVEVVQADAVEYEHAGQAPVEYVLLSGLTIYLSDERLARLLGKVASYTTEEAVLIHRDAYGVSSRFELDQRYSDALSAEYSAIYRTREEYDALFSAHGFENIHDSDMHDAGSEFNKWSETRLKLTVYRGRKR